MSLLLTEGLTSWLLLATLAVPLVLYFVNLIGRRFKYSDKKLPPSNPLSLIEMAYLGLRGKTNFQKLICRAGNKGPLFMSNWIWPRVRLLSINDFDLAKQLFNTNIFNGRPDNQFWSYHAKGNYGLVSSYGKTWEDQRRFTLRTLKDMGMGNKSMESLIGVEVEHFLDALASHRGVAFTPNKMPALPILNTLWVVLTGKRITNEDKAESKMIHEAYEAFGRAVRMPVVVLIVTQKTKYNIMRMAQLLKKIPFRTNLGTIIKGFDNLRNYCDNMINQRKKLLADGKTPESFIDDYLKEVMATTNDKSSFYEEEGVMNLQATIADFLVAGGDTAANTLAWSMLHLIRNPEVQQKLQAEIDTVVGRERRPNLSDRPNCPYTTAFLMEVLRSTPVGITSLPHMTTEDTEVGSYFIPKNTIVIVNIAAIHGNEKIWGDPKVFRPERFLSEDGKSVVKNEAMIAFSIGKRKCPGATLAMDNLYLFISAICQRFNLKKDPSLKGQPPLKPTISFLSSPRKFFMVVEERT